MKDGPNIVGIAALIGDHARSEVLTALMADRALTATELADIAGVTKQTISGHLAKLLAAGLVTVDSQGRHRYYRLADRDVAQLLESLMGVAFRAGAVRLRSSPREPALRRARVCYDHLAGTLGVRVFEGLQQRGAFKYDANGIGLSEMGRLLFIQLGIDVPGYHVELGFDRLGCNPEQSLQCKYGSDEQASATPVGIRNSSGQVLHSVRLVGSLKKSIALRHKCPLTPTAIAPTM